MFCPKCGKENPDGARFCGGCGAEFPSNSPAVAEQEAQVAASPGVQAAQAGTGRVKKPVVIGVIAVVAVVAIGLIVYFMAFAPYSIDERTFPDAALRTSIANQYDKDNDGKITRDEAKGITSLNLSGSGVANLDGLQLFPNLAELDLSGTANLSTLDASKIKSVADLNLARSAASALDAKELANLQSLDARGSNISAIDLSGNSHLSSLYLDESVQVSGIANTGLREEWVMTKSVQKGYGGQYEGPNGGGGIDSDSSTTVEFTYDDDNNITSDARTYSYVSRGSQESSTTTTRRIWEDGLMVKAEQSGTSYPATTTFEYDSSNMLEKTTRTWSGSSSSSTTTESYTYNDAGKLTNRDSRTSYSSSSDSTYNSEYTYNDAGQLVATWYSYGYEPTTSEISYDEAGRVNHIVGEYVEFVFAYNDAGLLVQKERYYLSDGSRSEYGGTTTNYSYDERGRLVKAEAVYSYDTYTYTYTGTCEYGDNGLISRRTMNYTYQGTTTSSYDGSQEFTYARTFVPAASDPIVQPMYVGDPSTYTGNSYGLLYFDLLSDQDDIVRGAFETVANNRQYS